VSTVRVAQPGEVRIVQRDADATAAEQGVLEVPQSAIGIVVEDNSDDVDLFLDRRGQLLAGAATALPRR